MTSGDVTKPDDTAKERTCGWHDVWAERRLERPGDNLRRCPARWSRVSRNGEAARKHYRIQNPPDGVTTRYSIRYAGQRPPRHACCGSDASNALGVQCTPSRCRPAPALAGDPGSATADTVCDCHLSPSSTSANPCLAALQIYETQVRLFLEPLLDTYRPSHLTYTGTYSCRALAADDRRHPLPDAAPKLDTL